ncbi:MAG: NAD(P)-dependent oxidoreductase [Armatimonadetes bacterium]|nr:NAD(P)-dependent oxidoreductase [Armatimonadota bacterium]
MAEETKALPVLGFIGLGDMGGRMVKNLLREGYAVIGYDLNPERLRAAVEHGTQAAENAAEVVQKSEIVMTSVPSSEAFVETAERALLPQAREGQIFIELGTTVPLEIRRLAPEFQRCGAHLLDVPVSGWITGAESGTLSMWAGGEEEVFRRCLPILEVLGEPERIVYCGPSGSGQVIKGVHQLKSGLVNAAYLEAASLAVNCGLDIELVRKIFGRPGDPMAGPIERMAAGKGNEIGVKFRELPYYMREADAQDFPLPLTHTLYEFCDKGERVVIDDNRPAPSFWHELTRSSD